MCITALVNSCCSLDCYCTSAPVGVLLMDMATAVVGSVLSLLLLQWLRVLHATHT